MLVAWEGVPTDSQHPTPHRAEHFRTELSILGRWIFGNSRFIDGASSGSRDVIASYAMLRSLG